jgi:hypothetical protein
MLQVNDSLNQSVIVVLFAQFYIFIPFLTNHWSEINVYMADDSPTLLKLKQLQVDCHNLNSDFTSRWFHGTKA